MIDVKGIMPGMRVVRKMSFAFRTEFSAGVSVSTTRTRIALPDPSTGINAAEEVPATATYNESEFSRTMKVRTSKTSPFSCDNNRRTTMKIELKYCSS